jgi:hypothetical protein
MKILSKVWAEFWKTVTETTCWDLENMQKIFGLVSIIMNDGFAYSSNLFLFFYFMRWLVIYSVSSAILGSADNVMTWLSYFFPNKNLQSSSKNSKNGRHKSEMELLNGMFSWGFWTTRVFSDSSFCLVFSVLLNSIHE